MDGYEILLLAPPVLALLAAWAASHAIKKSAREIDRRRDELHVRRERAMEMEMQRRSPPMQSTAPMRHIPPA